MAVIAHSRTLALQSAVPRTTTGATGGGFLMTSIVGMLSSDSCVLASDVDGNVISYASATTVMRVLVGAVDDSANWTFSAVSSAGEGGDDVVFNLIDNVIEITGLSADSAYDDITASRDGYADIIKRFSLSKARTGAIGRRGNIDIATALAGTTWSDGSAVGAIAAAGYGIPQERDIVTLYNSSANWTESRYYSGGNWLPLTAYIDGNLLVSGTVTADHLDAASGMFSGDVETTGYVKLFGPGNGIYVLKVQNNSSTTAFAAQFAENNVNGDVVVHVTSTYGDGIYCDGTLRITDSSLVSNLNANYLQGHAASYFSPVEHGHLVSDISSGAATAKFRWSDDGGVTWTPIHLQRLEW